MATSFVKDFLFASDFDQTLSFNDSGVVLTELLGIPAADFERKVRGMAELNLVQQGGELAYLLLHDPDFRSRVRRQHLIEAGKLIPLKENIDVLYRTLNAGIGEYKFHFYVVSAAPVEIVRSALKGIIPPDHIFGTEFEYNEKGEIKRIIRASAGYGKVARITQLQGELNIGPANVIFAGDGSSDVHVMLHVNGEAGLTIAVSETRKVTAIAKRTVLSTNALAMLVPILEEIAHWDHTQVREFFESQGFTVREWARVRTDFLTLQSAKALSTVGGRD